MKRTINNFFLLMASAVICCIFASCDPNAAKQDFSVAFKAAGPGYVTVEATVPEPIEVAYLCKETPLSTTDANIIFMTGKKTTFTASGEQQLLAEIKESTDYHLYLVARLSASEFSEVYTFQFNSGSFAFDELCTVVAVMNDGYKMRITVPESVRKSVPGTPGSRGIRYTQCDLMMYNLKRKTSDEYWMLLTNAGSHVTEDATIEYSDAKNTMQSSEDLNEDGVVDEKDETYRWNPISPGEPVVFLAGELEWMQLPEEYQGSEAPNYVVDGWEYPAGWPAGYYLPMIDGAKYDQYYGLDSKSPATKGINIIDDIDIHTPVDDMWTGAFQKKLFRTRIPDPLDAQVDVEVVELGPVNATLAFTPDPKVMFYSVCILDNGTYGEMLELLDNKEEYLQWATASFFSIYNFGSMVFEGPSEIVLEDFFYDVPADTQYHVLVTGMGDELGLTQCFKHFTFNTPPKTKTSGPKIEVTALESESGPYEAKFLVKCTSVADNPVKRCYYGANYYKDWIYAINKGGTYLQYGQSSAFSATEVQKINSPEGLVVSIPSIDGETTRLVVVGFNDENTPNDLNYDDITECPAVADLTTPYFEAVPCRAYYEMKSKFAGDWVMSATVLDESAQTGRRVLTRNVSILDKYADYPAEITDEIYKVYREHTKWTDAEIAAYYEEFLQNAEMFNTKRLANQNKLLLLGWLDGGIDVAYNTMTPYDLFVSETISTVDVPSIFSDFGPKMFIEISEENGKPKYTITADMYFSSPVMNWSDPFYMAGRADAQTNNTIFYYSDSVTGYYAAPLVFDVVPSDDFSTITIKAIEGNGVKYYPNVIGQNSTTGQYMIKNPIVSEVVLTRGSASAAAPVVSAGTGAGNSVVPVAEALQISHKKMTRFEAPVKRTKATMKVMTQERAHANYEKYLRQIDKSNN